jgi:hypothetical protein
LLKKLGWSPQYPAPRAVERNDKLVEAWLHHDWPRIKKKRVESAQKLCCLMKPAFRSCTPWGLLGLHAGSARFCVV